MIERLSISDRTRLGVGVAVLLSLPALLGVLVNLVNVSASLTGDETICWGASGARLSSCGVDDGGIQPVIYAVQALLFALPVVGLLWVVSWWATRPLRAWSASVDAMGPQNLGQRLSPTGRRDPARQLATSIDRLMDRVANGYEAQRRFAANASHELRTPLAVQRTLVEVAMDDPDVRRHLAPLARQLLTTNERNEHLIEGLVALADSDRGLVGAAPVPLDAVVERVLQAQVHAAERERVAMTVRAEATTVLGDEVLLERLVANLVQNAIRYNREGGRVHVDVAPGRLTVVNTGPAVPPESIPGLFEPFRRGSGERVEHRGGAGLGLAIVKSIVEAHGATITVEAGRDGGLSVAVLGLPGPRRRP